MGNLIYKWKVYFACILFVAKADILLKFFGTETCKSTVGMKTLFPPTERKVETCLFEMALNRWNR